MSLAVLYEDNHLLAVAKPAGVATMGVPAGRPSVLAMAKQYLREKYQKPGNVYLGVVSRLDAPVTGVLLFARTSKAAARLTNQFRGGEVGKLYWAVLETPPAPRSGVCQDWLRPDARHRRVHLATQHESDAKRARLRYRTLKKLRAGALVEVQLETGRKHQIRVQFGTRGWSVWGDRKYGARQAFPDGIALHARRLEFVHPVRQNRVALQAPLPASWRQFGIDG